MANRRDQHRPRSHRSLDHRLPLTLKRNESASLELSTLNWQINSKNLSSVDGAITPQGELLRIAEE